MFRHALIFAATVIAVGVAGVASAGAQMMVGAVDAPTSGTWDRTHTYGVNGKKRTCTLTRGAKCVGAKLRGKVKHHGDLRGPTCAGPTCAMPTFAGPTSQARTFAAPT
jgi:hypothetical protein